MKLVALRSRIPLVAAALLVASAACKTTPERARNDPANLQPQSKSKQLRTTARNSDVSFQAFVNRLRQAVKAHDLNEIAGMMTANFGYHIDPDLSGRGVFAYWDQNNVWPELDLVLNEKFVVLGGGDTQEFMVSPPEFAFDPVNYAGYRAGITLEQGSWKFAYFVSGKSVEESNTTDITPE